MPNPFGGDNMGDDYAPWTKSAQELEIEIHGVKYAVSQNTIDACYAHPMSIMRVGPHLIRVTQWLETAPVQIGAWDLVKVPGEK